ncbi:spore coat protein SP75 [Heterostelium album PN500]|uniref:Spore coat protein SP75 n=1 Tax=Heterostelium pallidum (strain ATCC 26659 / Pp 5 / PN500) TaxID=670386 RepID=D3B1S7_HETP5|nr:spore coat protein SP75 [Heterostelium album PN500]EFA85251.1 spore coat protein SP75 [Heterostelium album PN500]|eukprot:XP_020437360.1 spore coat protein SP75 [Heterostelium album PN500]
MGLESVIIMLVSILLIVSVAYGTEWSADASCSTLLCQYYQKCIEINGVAQCIDQTSYVPYISPCIRYSISCTDNKPGTFCQTNANHVTNCTTTPITSSNPCDRVLCQTDMKCIVQNGSPVCIKSSPPVDACTGFTCLGGLQCKVINNVPTCVPVTPPIDQCTNYPCNDGFRCVVINNVPTCIPNSGSPTCNGQVCAPGTLCADVNGLFSCVPYQIVSGLQPIPTSCSATSCKIGYKCVLVNSIPTCVKINGPSGPICGLQHCELDEFCISINGHPQCISNSTGPLDKCPTVVCLDGFSCIAINNVPTCVPQDQLTLCGDRICPFDKICANFNGNRTCIKLSDLINPPTTGATCGISRCQVGFKCVLVNSIPTCVAESPASCGNQVCDPVREVCANFNGKHICIPRTTITSGHITSGHITSGHITSGHISSGPITSGPITGSGTLGGVSVTQCGNQKCLFGFQCLSLNGVPTCVPPSQATDPLCGGRLCPVGQICLNINNIKRCAPFKALLTKQD